MRMLGKWLVASALAVSPAALRAEEPHLEIIRGLRAQGDPELALRYINEQLAGKVPAEMVEIVALEKARTNVEIARQEAEEGKRLALFASARTEFESFLKNHPTHELAPQAGFEIARLIASQGKEQLNRARRTAGESRTKAMRDARPLFEQSAEKLRAAAKQLNDQMKKVEPNSTTYRDLNQSYFLAQLEEGVNLYLLATTFATDVPAEIKLRATTILKAQKVFETLQDQDLKHPVCWLGRAWAGRCLFENDDYGKATLALDAVQAERGAHAEEAKRVGAYFRILMLRKQGTPAQVSTMIQRWLDQYRAYWNTPEGCGARYFLADAQESLAGAGIKRDPNGRPIQVSPDAATRLKEAERHLRALTEFENDFTDRAANKRMGIILAIAIRETPDRDPAKVKTFENCYLLSLLEIAELNEELKKPEFENDFDKVKDLRRKHYGRVIRALERGLTLVSANDPPAEVLDARIRLVYAYFVAGNNHYAAVLGEHLANGLTRTSRGAVPALYSLQAYRNVMLDTKSRGDIKEAELRADREQVHRMATFMEAAWPNDSPTDAARHTLGSLFFSEGDHVKALETFARVTPHYVSLAHLRNDQGIACFNLQKDPKVPAAVKRQWFDHTVKLLTALPDLGTGAEPDTAFAYCKARLQLASLYLQEGKQYQAVESIAKSVLDQHTKLVLGDKAAEVKAMAQAMQLYGLYGRVYELVKTNRHTDAATLYMPAVAEMKKGIPEDDASVRVRKAMSDLLQLALRSSVQEGQIERAQDMLKLLEKASAGTNPAGALVQVLRDVQSQINDMRRHDPNRLAETLDKFTGFLDALARQQNLSREVKIFLAQGFDSLDQPVRAVELLASIPAPPGKDPGAAPSPPAPLTPLAKDATATEQKKFKDATARYNEDRAKYTEAKAKYEQEAEPWRPFWFTQLTHVRALRHAARLETDKTKKDHYFNAADKLLKEIIGASQKKGWAFDSLEVRREAIFLLEDREDWKAAHQKWIEMMQPFRKFSIPPKDDKEARIRTAYYEVRFYLTRVVYKSKLKMKDEKRKQTDIQRLADQIVELEKDARTADFGGESVKKLYQEWLESEELVRKAYQAAGGKALLGPPDVSAASQ